MKKPNYSFSEFVGWFPEMELPITLTAESTKTFDDLNEPFPALMIETFIAPIETDPIDEFTEFTPCLKIPGTFDFHALIYWRGSLMNHQFILATFTKQGVLINKKVIAGTFSDGKTLTQSIATIDEDFEILIVSGQSGLLDTNYDASTSTTIKLELLPEGQIVTID